MDVYVRRVTGSVGALPAFLAVVFGLILSSPGQA
jgi:hypothetical protein